MKKLLVYLLLICSFSQVAYGDEGGAVYLPSGSTTTFDGFLITPEKAQKFRLIDLSLQQELKTNELLTKENLLFSERLANREQQIDLLAKRVVEDKDSALWSKIGFFLLGSLLTGAIAVGVSRLK